MADEPTQRNDRDLMLYLAAKMALLTAIADSLHMMLVKDLAPPDPKLAEQRRWVIQQIYNSNITAEREHLKAQFPADYTALEEYITLIEKESEDANWQVILDVLEGKQNLPDAFRESPPEKKPGDDEPPPPTT